MIKWKFDKWTEFLQEKYKGSVVGVIQVIEVRNQVSCDCFSLIWSYVHVWPRFNLMNISKLIDVIHVDMMLYIWVIYDIVYVRRYVDV